MKPEPKRIPRQRKHTAGRITRMNWEPKDAAIAESLAAEIDMSYDVMEVTR
jgi:hypothetical protein